MLGRWAQAILDNREHVVLGRTLRPFSLGHAFILRATANPAVYDGPCDMGRLAVAVDVCASAFEDGRRHICDLSRVRLYEAWARHLTRPIHWWQPRRDIDFPAHLTAFRAYCNVWLTVPLRWEKRGALKKSPRAPWELHLVRGLCADWGMSYEDAMDTPISRALALRAVSSESDGDESLVSDSEAACLPELFMEGAA